MQDLSRLGRELNQVVIIDNSPMSYMFHPQNAVSSFLHCSCLTSVSCWCHVVWNLVYGIRNTFESVLLCAKVPVISWFDDMSDCELLKLIPFFEALADIDDVYTFLRTVDQLPNHVADTDAILPTPADDSNSDGQVDQEVSATEDTAEQE